MDDSDMFADSRDENDIDEEDDKMIFFFIYLFIYLFFF